MSHSTSKILCRIDAKAIHGFLNLPDNYPDSGESMNESVLAEVYRGCKTEIRCEFLSSILNEGQSLEGLFLPYHIHIFKEEVQLVVSLVCQVLGLDDDVHVSEVVLGFFLKMSSVSLESESHPVHVLNLDEYLAEAIHIQLVEFSKVRFFKY